MIKSQYLYNVFYVTIKLCEIGNYYKIVMDRIIYKKNSKFKMIRYIDFYIKIVLNIIIRFLTVYSYTMHTT